MIEIFGRDSFYESITLIESLDSVCLNGMFILVDFLARNIEWWQWYKGRPFGRMLKTYTIRHKLNYENFLLSYDSLELLI